MELQCAAVIRVPGKGSPTAQCKRPPAGVRDLYFTEGRGHTLVVVCADHIRGKYVIRWATSAAIDPAVAPREWVSAWLAQRVPYIRQRVDIAQEELHAARAAEAWADGVSVAAGIDLDAVITAVAAQRKAEQAERQAAIAAIKEQAAARAAAE